MLEINGSAKIFDRNQLEHILKHLRLTKNKFELNSSININKKEDILKIATALYKHSKNLAHHYEFEEEVNLKLF